MATTLLDALSEFDDFAKIAFQPMGPPGPPPGAPPMDPAMMGGAPPMDPAMMGGAPPMPPGGGMPMDPAMMGGAPPMPPGAPPMDPAMMGGAPPPGGMPPDVMAQLEEMLAQITEGITQLGQLGQQNQTGIDSVTQEVAGMKEKLMETSMRVDMLDKALKDASPAMGAAAPAAVAIQ